jgi:prepilin-type N-terminal cleavage/methylation domain-containing protein
MKLTNTRNIKSKSGMTLLELTVVILVLLSLISILFVGARAWKKGSDRAANIMNLRNVQQAVRGHQNMHGLNATDTLASTMIVQDVDGATTTTGYLKTPKVPWDAAAAYTYLGTVPAIGTLYLIAPAEGQVGATYGPTKAADYSDW